MVSVERLQVYIAVLVSNRFSLVSGTLDEWSTGLVRAREIVSVQRFTMPHIEVQQGCNRGATEVQHMRHMRYRGAPGVQQRCNRGATEPRTYETHAL